jgi:hypothetical protein
MLSVNDLVSHVAAVLATGTGSLFFSRGDGAYV